MMPDYEQMDVEELEPLANSGDRDVQFYLGVIYDYDKREGVELDYKKAVVWYEKAVEQGHPEACYNLGVLYACGEGVELDYKEAFSLFKQAFELGYEGVEKDLFFILECLGSFMFSDCYSAGDLFTEDARDQKALADEIYNFLETLNSNKMANELSVPEPK